MSENPFDDFATLYDRVLRFIKYVGFVCIFFTLIFILMSCIGAGFYYGASKGGWTAEQEIHCENTNLFPGSCVITEIASANK